MLDYPAADQVPPLAGLDPVDILITDYAMGGEDGISFARRFLAARPDVPVLVITGYCTPHVESKVEETDRVSLLCKPFEYEELRGLVQGLVLGAHPHRPGDRPRRRPGCGRA